MKDINVIKQILIFILLQLLFLSNIATAKSETTQKPIASKNRSKKELKTLKDKI